MKIYTKTGDAGTTSLYGGVKVSKANIRIDAYGTTDELNALLGCVWSGKVNETIKDQLQEIQKEIFMLGAELATPKEKLHLANGKSRIGKMIQDVDIERIESWIDEWEKDLPALTHFILPSGTQDASFAHLARTVCRRAERIVVALSEHEEIRNVCQKYLNRLSDYLFVIARVINSNHAFTDIKWLPEKD